MEIFTGRVARSAECLWGERSVFFARFAEWQQIAFPSPGVRGLCDDRDVGKFISERGGAAR
jgi:hypothetical protein